MAAIGCRIARIGQKQISAAGAVVAKDTATISEMIQTTREDRVLEDLVNAPNSLGYPTIEQYIMLEAQAGYKVETINQTMIITYAT